MMLAWTYLTVGLQAQQVTVSPLPQEINWGSTKAFDKGFSYTITGEQDADVDAVRVLKTEVPQGAGTSVEIIIGERGDAAVAAYVANIPDKKDGYFLKVEPDKVVIAGHDGNGTFYGVQTFLQIASQQEVMQVTVTDYPDVMDRGVVEGFYGNWWSQTDRIRQFEFYGKNKMNVYIYAPKDDPYHRSKWRDPYPETEANRLKELVAKAKENKVQFVWSIHPGNDIQWNATDMQKVLDKFELMYGMGVRAFGLLFDDISGAEQSRADKQAELINYVTDNFIKKYPELPPIIFCPTLYNQSWAGDGSYLRTLGAQANKEVRIMWTGATVVDMINKNDMDWINDKLQRNAYIWLNYPTNDYCIDRMLMGPTYGNDLDIAGQLSGFTANPSEYAEASKVSLYSIADYTWNMTAYDENASWERAIKYLMPDHADALRVFCENNIDLGNTAHGLRRKDESKRFAEAIKVFESEIADGLNQAAFDKIKPMFDEFVTSCEELLSSQVQEKYPLAKELIAWFQVMKLIGERGQNMCSLYAAIDGQQPEEFLRLYKEMLQMEADQKAIRSRDFEGSIKSPNPTVAAEVVAPFMKKYTDRLIAEYKKHYSEGWENFPAVLLNDGKYYIKYDGKFLTNVNGSNTPTFVTEKDNINPPRQEWIVTTDYSTGRYKIVNAQDQRHLNEIGDLGNSDRYNANWNTYRIGRMNGKYAIQNAGYGGDKFWKVEDLRIKPSNSASYSINNFIFELIPLDEEQVKHPVIETGKVYHIINAADGSYLTNNKNNYPSFQDRIEQDGQNVQRWIFTVVPETGRFKIVSEADNRNLNENGQFGTAYDPTWNTYIIQEMGGQFMIQCAGNAGNKFWTIENNTIKKGDKSENESYIFKLVEAKKTFPPFESSDAPVNGQFAERTQWYKLRMNYGELVYNAGQQQQIASTAETGYDDRYWWAFVGDEETGYEVYNKAAGASMKLQCESGSGEGTSQRPRMVSVSDQNDQLKDKWQFHKTETTLGGVQGIPFNISLQGESGYKISIHNGEPHYLKFWTGTDVNSVAYVISTEGSVRDYLNLPDGAVDGLKTTDKLALQEAVKIQDFQKMDQIIKERKIGFDANKFYRLRNVHNLREGFLSLNAEEKLRAYTTLDESSVNMLWKIESSGENVKLYHANAKLYADGVGNQQNINLSIGLSDEGATYTQKKWTVGQYGFHINGMYLVQSKPTGDIGAWNEGGINSDHAWYIVEVSSMEFTVTEAGYATLNYPFAVQLPEGMTAYTGTLSAEKDVFNLEEISNGIIPANTPVVLQGEAGTYRLTILADNTDPKIDSDLEGICLSRQISAESNAYVLGDGDNGVGFYKLSPDDRTLAANKAFLELPQHVMGIRSITIGQTTGMERVDVLDDREEIYYDLQGRRVINPIKGIYITQSGKKVFFNK